MCGYSAANDTSLPNSAHDAVRAGNDRGRHNAPVPTVRRVEDDFDGLRHILVDHRNDMSQTPREIIADEFFDGRRGADIAAHRGTSVNTCDIHRQPRFHIRRATVTTPAATTTEIDLPAWYDCVEEMSRRDAARNRRRASCEKENRSSFGGDRFNFGGDRFNFGGDRSTFEPNRSNSRCDGEKGRTRP